jgi:hypothetical protein
MARTVKIIKNAKVGFGDPPVSGGAGAVVPSTLTDYGCQVTEARITAAANTSDVPATFCEPASTVNVPSSFTLELNGLQDWGASGSFSEYLFKHDAEIQAFAVYLDGSTDPVAKGLVSVAAGDFGGPAGETLVLTGSFPLLGYPVITKTDGSSLRPGAPATGATAGIPGAWTPAGSTPPANAAGATSSAVVASPATAWTTGQYVQGSTAGVPGEMYWSGTAWTAGRKP